MVDIEILKLLGLLHLEAGILCGLKIMFKKFTKTLYSSLF